MGERLEAPVFLWSATVGLLGRVRLAASEHGLCRLAFETESEAAFDAWLERHLRPVRVIEQPNACIRRALDELETYLAGISSVFGTPLDLRGSSFQRSVWQQVDRIPYGRTATYGEIANRLGRPGAARAVGAANGANPVPVFVPCHRLVGAGGSLRGYGAGLHVKAALLALERENRN
jgi:O-6-methylguanine DNA methyltransferase